MISAVPPLVHVIFGFGLPVALHFMSMLLIVMLYLVRSLLVNLGNSAINYNKLAKLSHEVKYEIKV
jgi:hypothetical protein